MPLTIEALAGLSGIIASMLPGYNGYRLEHYTRTLSRAGGDEDAILAKFPYICSYQSLVRALDGSGIIFGTPYRRNPNGYTKEEMAEIIIDRFDQIMYDTWYNSKVYEPKSFSGSIAAGYRWDQVDFWNNFGTHFIYHAGGGAGNAMYVLDNVANEDIILLPEKGYNYSVKEFIQKPFLGFDVGMMSSEFGAELDLDPSTKKVTGLTNALVDAGSFVTGVEYNIREPGDTDFTLIGATQNTVNTVFTATGPGTGTGKARETAGILSDDADNPIPADEIHPSLLHVYDYNWYHETLNENGTNDSYYGSFYTTTGVEDSKRWYDKSVAKFEVTVTDGRVTAITGVARQDGDGVDVVGGWGYGSSNDYMELNFGASPEVGEVSPRILVRTHIDQSGYTGNKATVNISDPTSEFYPGLNLEAEDVPQYVYAIRGGVSYGYEQDPLDHFDGRYDDWFDRNWSATVLPKSVRVGVERPTLISTTRSLRTIRTGTGAHRYSFEFEYPPLTYAEFSDIADRFELAKGAALEIQLPIPKSVMPHSESIFYDVPLDVATNNAQVISGGLVGDDVVVINGVRPGHYAGKGFYFLFNSDTKIYRCIDTSVADEYGRIAVKFEPPLRRTATSSRIRLRNTNKYRSDFFQVRAYLADDVLDYTVDAAGYYRISPIKFVESLV